MKKRVLAGMRATGRLHLGNYLGGVKGMLALQDNPAYETLYMVADMHAVTTPYSVEELQSHRREVLIDYLAAGLDPEKSVLFLQSDVMLHGELAFYLSSVMTLHGCSTCQRLKIKSNNIQSTQLWHFLIIHC